MKEIRFGASVTFMPLHSEVREFMIPEIPSDGGILAIEAAGVCGSDIGAHSEEAPERILGHENVGTIYRIGDIAKARWGVDVGDRVVLEEYLPCGHCDLCQTTQFRFCKETDSRGGGVRYGTTGLNTTPGLWGGYSEYMYLHPRSIMHRAPLDVPAELLTLSLPLGNGYEWTCIEGASSPGKTVAIFGPGQQGLACVYAAKRSGAECVVLFGLESDSHRLDVALQLGADYVVSSNEVNPAQFIAEVTNGKMADIVIDSAVGNSATINAGIEMLKQEGKLLLATALDKVDSIAMRSAQWKCLTIKGVRGHSFASVEWAIQRISKDSDLLALMCTQSFGLDQVDTAILATANKTSHKSIHVTVVPGRSD